MQSGRLLRSKLAKRRVWRRIFLERLTEPLHLNLLSLLVLAGGSFRARVNWDLVVRQHYAYGLLKAADLAAAAGKSGVTVVEFGVASGAGVMNLAAIARRVAATTGVRVHIVGFDTGEGMPPAVDYRDHPDLYQQGDFSMDADQLRSSLPANVTLRLGPLRQTVPEFLDDLSPESPLGFVALDVDYYSSTVDALRIFEHPDPTRYLPTVVVYADDINLEQHNSACGELLALREFNGLHPMRPIEHNAFLEHSRVFRRAAWVQQILFAHILDHPHRSEVRTAATKRYIENPYLDSSQRERFYIDSTEPA